MDSAKRANAAFLIGAFSIIHLKKTPEEAYRPLVAGNIPPYRKFCDASYGNPFYKISISDCLDAIYKAVNLNFFDIDDFTPDEYEFYEVIFLFVIFKMFFFSL